MLRKILLAVLLLLLLAALGFGIWLSQANNYQAEGTIHLDVLDKPVRVLRDSAGVPYIYAENFADALRAQGFVSAQDRLFQLVFTQHLVTGRLAELIGPAGVEQDTKMRVLGVPRHGRAHAALLGEKSRRHLELYLQGLNAYIAQMQAEQPLGLTVMGIEAQPWTLEESVALRYFLSWASTPNMDAELISLQLIDKLGPERAQAISQMSRNTDVGVSVAAEYGQALLSSAARNDVVVKHQNQRTDSFADKFALGSNHWVVDGSLTESGRPLLVNNPHIDTRSLPGTWHPLGIITPDFRAVGVAGPGTVGLAIARTEHIAYGVTNSYGDGIDLFIETADPDNPEHYLEQGRSVPYEIIEEVMRVRDFQNGGFSEQPLRIRLTRRGPVISDHGMTPDDGRIITARWAAPEYMSADLGELGPMLASSVQEAGDEIAHINAPYNYVVIDSENNIGHFTAGRVPVRKNGDGSLPLPADIAVDNWDGLIAAKDMPGVINPGRGWVGNANNRTLPADYPYAYSTYFAHTWRYERMLQLLDNRQVRGPADHWAMMLDTANTLAERITPLMLASLKDKEEFKEEFADLSAYLSGWDYVDDADEIAPTVFQSVWHHFVRRVYGDELGPELATEMLGNYYYWEERLWSFVQAGESVWFDDINTTTVETMQDQFVLAARDARVELTEKLGPDSSQWQWGKLHTVTFFSPIAPGDVAAKWLGGGTFPKEGSGETLNRGKYKFSEPYRSVYIDSMRFVADMNDDEKVWAVLSGGASGRQFDPHLKDQMAVWLTGEPNYWWFSDAAIREHAVSELELAP